MSDYNFAWKNIGDKYYYYNVRTGKIAGVAFKYPNHDVWVAYVHIGEYGFTQENEKHLGQYIDFDFAKQAVVYYWEMQSRTLIEN
jgi:hypothetical protein